MKTYKTAIGARRAITKLAKSETISRHLEQANASLMAFGRADGTWIVDVYCGGSAKDAVAALEVQHEVNEWLANGW
jgi:hypothetical protein